LTIHQPSTEILKLFDKLLILTHGQVAYLGPTVDAIDYFGDLGFKCPEDENPASYFMKLVHFSPTGEISGFEKTHKMASYLHKKYLNSDYFKYGTTKKKSPPPCVIDTSDRPGFFKQLQKLLVNEFNKSIKEPNAFRATLIQVILISLIMGVIYLNLGHTQASIQDRAGALFFLIANALFGGLSGPFRNVLIEQRIFFYHNQEGLYSTVPFVIAKYVVLLPEILIGNSIFVTIFYFMVKLQLVGSKIVLFYVVEAVTGWTALSFGTFILYVFDDPAVAQTVFPIFFIPMMIFSGFYANAKTTPVYFIWAEYLSLLKYGFNSVARIEFENNTFYCTDAELKNYGGVCPFTKGEDWLNFRGLNVLEFWECMVILVAFIVFYLAIGSIILKGRVRARKS